MKPEGPYDSKLDKALDRHIEALLAVEPSPEFLARVRRRIAHAPEASAWKFRWMFAGAGALAAVIVAVRMIIPAHEPARVEAPDEPPVAAGRSAERTPSVVEPAVRSQNVSKTGVKQPEVLIAAGEAAALRRLMNGPLVQLPAGFLEPATMELQLREIEIKPLAIPAPVTIEPIEPPAPLFEGKGEL